ncbi:UvrD-helicase domain-containing protein [Mucisphaera calidilacus]|uniref:DNA 3'-5' helicase n=1 Tax=Mucisphaera calidilacus TaxID=2527982 RepID=A0A518BYP4_9BACT|nr:UvrD-helicase domain-containing protein [Mucisphaera calidilacus]QDU72074.1 ATP-dependent helicase/nuclease subunit A [Mucisphaera calidilacus]
MTRVRHQVIRASAGSGKTFRLACQYLTLLHEGADPRRILATTFTRAAAGEIRDRVLSWLVGAANDEQALAGLRSDTGLDLSRDDVEVLFDRLLPALPGLPIGTIDATFQRLAGMFAFELGMPDDPVMLDERSSLADDLRQRSIERLLANYTDQEEIDTLGQWVRQLASGASRRSVTQAILEVSAEMYDVWTQAPDAALWSFGDYGHRLTDDRLNEAIDRLQSCHDILPQTKAGKPNKLFSRAWQALLDAARAQEWLGVLGNGLATKVRLREPTFSRGDITPEFVAAIRPLIDHALAHISEAYAWRTSASAHFLERFAEAWREITAEQGVAFYSEPTRLLGQRIRQSTADWITDLYFRLDGQVTHLMLDEFQDTSREQWDVLQPLVEELLAHGRAEESGRSLFCVGDTKQAIYGWRGGDVRLFDEVAEMADRAGSRSESLGRIYRCAQPVLDAVNDVFMHASDVSIYQTDEEREAVSDWVKKYPEHVAARADRPGYVTIRCTSPADDDAGADVHLDEVARYVANLHRGMPERSVGVLVSRRVVATDLILALRALGVDASDQGGVPIEGDSAVEAVLSVMRLADHPGDEAAAFHVRNSPLAEVVRLPDDARQLGSWAARLRGVLLREGFGRVLQRWIQPLAGQCDARRWRRLTQLLVLAQQFDAVAGAQPEPPALRPLAFVHHVRTTSVRDPSASPVRVMTIHASKGLEFDAVVLPDLEQTWRARGGLAIDRDPETHQIRRVAVSPSSDLRGYFPEIEASVNATNAVELIERLCLLYVAMTRARYGLYVFLRPVAAIKGGVSKEGTRNRTHASLIRQTLGIELKADDVAAEYRSYGEPDWHERAGSEPVEPPPDCVPLRLTLASGSAPTRQSATAHGVVPRLATIFQQDRASEATSRGDAVHTLLEGVGFLDEQIPAWCADDEAALELLRDAGLPVDRHDRVMDWVREARSALSAPPIAEALSRRGAAETRSEVPFAFRDDAGHLHTGRIDRLVVWQRGGRPVAAEVLDFKTDRVTDSEADRALTCDRHAEQVQRYVRAAARVLGLDASEVRGRLLMVHPGSVIGIDSSAG